MTPAGGSPNNSPDVRDTQGIPDALYLVDVQRLLSLFSEGISGRTIAIEAIADDANNRPASSAHRINCITSDGQTIFLPERLTSYSSRRYNLGAYRIAILHQIGYDACGTFKFRLSAAANRIPGIKARIAERSIPATPDNETTQWRVQPKSSPKLDLEIFFELFDAPWLMKQIFAIIEAWRIDRYIQTRYPGAAGDLHRAMSFALASREYKPAVQASASNRSNTSPNPITRCLAALTNFTLGAQANPAIWSEQKRSNHDSGQTESKDPFISQLLNIAGNLPAGADVYDSARITRDINELIQSHFKDSRAGGTADNADLTDPTPEDQAQADADARDGNPVDYRGDPFSMPAIHKRRDAAQELADPDNNEIIDSVNTAEQDDEETADSTATPQRMATVPLPPKPKDGERHFLVDEWNYKDKRYLKGWCTIVEYQLRGDPGLFHRDLMNRHRDSFARTKRQFNAIRPEAIRRERRQPDGEEIELDRLVERLTDRRAGIYTDDRLYLQRLRAQRDVAAAFLLDMSASTDFPVPDQTTTAPFDDGNSADLADDIGWAPLARSRTPIPVPPIKRRVIDVARESLALMSTALETLGDRYAIYGFSGQGRHWVSFGVAKRFDEACTAKTWGAIAAIGPQGSTRMGAAVRHTSEQLRRERTRLKVLIIVSDGYPQDLDYGPDRGNDEYGLQDTAMALLEAKRLGIETFCLTVDPAGNDYLRRMCPDQRYLVIDEVNALPVELGKVYRALTTRATR